MKPITEGLRPVFLVYVTLLVLLALTASATFLPAGPWKAPIGLAIAVAKAGLIFTYFMRLRKAAGIVRVFALAGFVWLAIAVILVLTDFVSRNVRA